LLQRYLCFDLGIFGRSGYLSWFVHAFVGAYFVKNGSFFPVCVGFYSLDGIIPF